MHGVIPGKRGDIAVLNANPSTFSEDEPARLQVEMTRVAGEVRYRAN